MSFDPVFNDAVKKWMDGKGVDVTCPACKSKAVGMGNIVELMTVPEGRAQPSERQSVPMLPIICMDCGFTSLFSLGVTGIAPPRT